MQICLAQIDAIKEYKESSFSIENTFLLVVIRMEEILLYLLYNGSQVWLCRDQTLF